MSLTQNQVKTLKTIKAGFVPIGDIDGRAIKALERRGLVSKKENKKGVFFKANAKGIKALN